MPTQSVGLAARLARGVLATLLAGAGLPVWAEEGKVVYAEVAADEVSEVDSVIQAAIAEDVADGDAVKDDLLLVRLVKLSPEAASRLEAWDQLLPQVKIAKDGESRVLSVPKTIFGSANKAHYDRLRASFDLSVLDFPRRLGAYATQQIVSRESADKTLALLLNTKSAPSTPQEEVCAVSSNQMSKVQRLVPDEHLSSAAIGEFDRACLGTLVPGQELLALPAYVRDSGAIKILGVLERAITGHDGVETREAFCSAFLVDENTIVSARHCFYDVRRPTARTETGEAWDDGEVYFQRVVPQYASVKVGPRLAVNWLDADDAKYLPRSQRPLSAADDFIAFTLDAVIPDIPEVRFDPEEGVQQAWVAGPAGIVRDDRDMTNRNVPPSVLGMRWTRNAPCVTASSSHTCALHVCHSTQGASGAAIIGRSSDSAGVAITGIHLGPYAQLGKACPALMQNQQVNLNGAVRAPAFMAKILAVRDSDDQKN
ncbi:Trypsin [Lysobacter sp. yr284]|uniref:trypsin-like serine protease n=1 Tax=Lysobacter sp. yr284 TaxID=1761791 RepID=UPI000896C1D8|nr:trypsin-like serine protease [Lysobacter sp. yr284]SDZ18930.1 Trypsin [Lysobacter sp. yr284]